jgi:uncharacterized protein (DUF2252 family)
MPAHIDRQRPDSHTHENDRTNGHARKRKRSATAFKTAAPDDARRAQGRALRTSCPRSRHAITIVPEHARARDPLALIEQSNQGRVPSLLPVRFSRMLESPFAFFRGTANVQAHDLKGTPSPGIIVQCCGDCHLLNFGVFASPERTLLFDINDFDETLPAPFEWDLKRLATSFVMASRWRDFDKRAARKAVAAAARSYRQQIAQFASMSALDVWYARVTADDLIKRLARDAETSAPLAQLLAKANQRTGEAVFHKLTHEVHGHPRIVDQPPLIYHSDPAELDLHKDLSDFFEAYRATISADRRVLFGHYKLTDAAFKVVGVGSVGTICFIALFMGDNHDPLFLQVKQARPSVLEEAAGPSPHANDGERVVIGQRIMQSASDIFLGWANGPRGENFYVRQLRDHKVAPDLSTATENILIAYATVCGQTLARAHAKSGKAAEISGYLGAADNFDDALTDYAVAYADQVEADYHAFRAAAKAGRFPTETTRTEMETAIR